MVTNKEEFIRTFLPSNIDDITFAQIDMDITDLSVVDILRNVNKTYTKNTRSRNAIIDGKLAVGVLCKSELLYPLSGIMIIISNGEEDIKIVSRNYIVVGISEERIVSDDDIKALMDEITIYIIQQFRNPLQNVYRKILGKK